MPAATATSSTDGHERRALASNPNRTAGDRDTGTGAQRLYHVRHVRGRSSLFLLHMQACLRNFPLKYSTCKPHTPHAAPPPVCSNTTGDQKLYFLMLNVLYAAAHSNSTVTVLYLLHMSV
eukprot:scaffold104813_cov63-Phaeocystis_antarctica.AAC.3